ncbi:MAG: cell division FtsA domain-containing protein, partial [Patescibacteria group bacterium]
GVEIEDIVPSPIVAAEAVLTKTQKIAGCVLVNIGAETVSIIVYENDTPISIKVFPIGGTDITNDIALGLQIPLEEAEQLKIGGVIGANFSRKKLEEIVVARLSDIFELIENHLKKIGKNGLLPAGIILSGGGSGINTIEDLAKASLRLPSQSANLKTLSNFKNSIKDSTWAVAYGLCIFGLSTKIKNDLGLRHFRDKGIGIKNWFKQFLP